MRSVITLSLLLALTVAVGAYGETQTVSAGAGPGFSVKYALWASILGGLSAISLLMGAALGIVWKPRAGAMAALTAFGGGRCWRP